MDKFKQMLLEVITSKKALAALGTLVVIILQGLGVPITDAMVDKILMVVAPYLVGQGIADHGKAVAAIQAKMVEESRK